MGGVNAPRRLDVVGLSRQRQRLRRAVFRAEDRDDHAAVALLREKLRAAEELEMAAVPENEADARRKLINAAIEIRAIARWDDALRVDDELLRLARRRITVADLTWLRELLVRWEWDFQQNPLCGAERVLAPLRLAVAWFGRPVGVT